MGLGQKLEEARNRKGISLREVTETTKIRGDYLSSFESGNFDIDLPEVYLRGFVRLYSKYLGLDQDAVLADLDVELESIRSKSPKKSLGSITSGELSENTGLKGSSKKIEITKNSILPKIFLFSVGIIVLVFFLYFLKSCIGTEPDRKTSDEIVDDANVSLDPKNQLKVSEASKPRIGDHQLTLAAFGPLERLIICDEGQVPPKYYEFKNLQRGWEKTITFKSTFKCYTSSFENLRFFVNNGPEKKVSGTGGGSFSGSADLD